MALLFTINAASCTCHHHWEPRRGPRRRRKKMTTEMNNNIKNIMKYDSNANGNPAPTTPQKPAITQTNGGCSVGSGPIVAVMELQEYERPPGKEKNNLVRLEDLEHYVKHMTETAGFKEQYNMLKIGPQKPSTVASKPENKLKNRYFDLLPYDETRVVLQPSKDDPHGDNSFINGNYVDAYNKPKGYICTQGPLEKTVNDFWKMVWQEFVCKIVMAANIIENGKKKCEKYWPDATTKYGEILVTLQSESVFLDFTVRTFKVQKAGKSCRRLVRQYHFTGWPDHGVPVYPLSLLYMLKYMKDFQPNSKGPVVLHCSAGVGRSGTVMLLESALEMAKAVNKVDVLGLLYRMRQQRANLVETVEQYAFVYQTLVEGLCGDVPCLQASHLVMYYNRLRLTEPETNKTKLQLQFERLAQLTPLLPDERFIAAKAHDNRSKNRYDFILSPECGRPVLRSGGAQNYINSVYVNGYGKENAFLATQFPLHETIKDFWQLIYETDSRTIVTLNELPKNDETCPVFWPESGSVYHGSLKLDHTSSDELPGFKIRQFKLKNVDESKKSRPVKQFHLMGWSKDDIAPPAVDLIVKLLAKVEKWQAKSGDHPVIVTCYNGVKACGIYCSAAYMAEQVQKEKELDIFTALRTARLNRPEFISKEQYRWLYEIACSLSTCYAQC